jgi:hypothetical protein
MAVRPMGAVVRVKMSRLTEVDVIGIDEHDPAKGPKG